MTYDQKKTLTCQHGTTRLTSTILCYVHQYREGQADGGLPHMDFPGGHSSKYQ
jgi:hypothetical protein